MMKKIVITTALAMSLLLTSRYSVTYIDATNDESITKDYWVFEQPDIEPKTKEGYEFVDWIYIPNKKEPWRIGNTTVTAKWEPKTYRISYDLSEGVSLEGAKNAYCYNPQNTTSLPYATKPHHEFIGWKVAGSDTVLTELPKAYSGDIALTPVFQANTYAISYELNGGKLADNTPEAYTYGEAVDMISVSRKGYDFLGWYDSNGNAWDDIRWDGDVILTAHWKQQVPAESVQKVDGSGNDSGNGFSEETWNDDGSASTSEVNGNASASDPSDSPASGSAADRFGGASNWVIVGDVAITLTFGGGQADCDLPGNGTTGYRGGKLMIADHRHQGFSVIESLPIGSTAQICSEGVERTVTLRSRYYATNTIEEGYVLYDGRQHSDITDGDVVMVTCQAGSSGHDVVLTYWS